MAGDLACSPNCRVQGDLQKKKRRGKNRQSPLKSRAHGFHCCCQTKNRYSKTDCYTSVEAGSCKHLTCLFCLSRARPCFGVFQAKSFISLVHRVIPGPPSTPAPREPLCALSSPLNCGAKTEKRFRITSPSMAISHQILQSGLLNALKLARLHRLRSVLYWRC